MKYKIVNYEEINIRLRSHSQSEIQEALLSNNRPLKQLPITRISQYDYLSTQAPSEAPIGPAA